MACLQPRPIGVTTPSGLLPSRRRRPLPGHAHGAARNGARASARFQVCPLPNGTLVQVACGCGRDRKARRCYSAVRRRHRLFECNRTGKCPNVSLIFDLPLGLGAMVLRLEYRLCLKLCMPLNWTGFPIHQNRRRLVGVVSTGTPETERGRPLLFGTKRRRGRPEMAAATSSSLQSPEEHSSFDA